MNIHQNKKKKEWRVGNKTLWLLWFGLFWNYISLDQPHRILQTVARPILQKVWVWQCLILLVMRPKLISLWFQVCGDWPGQLLQACVHAGLFKKLVYIQITPRKTLKSTQLANWTSIISCFELTTTILENMVLPFIMVGDKGKRGMYLQFNFCSSAFFLI